MSKHPSPAGPWRHLNEGRAAAAEDEGALADQARALYPALGAMLEDPQSRRTVLRLLGAGMALGGLTGCGPSVPPGHITPPVIQAPGIVPGIADDYSSAVLQGGYANGIIVRHQEGRPIKVEGNPRHPASLGATDAIAQAQILSLYDPDRDRGVAEQGAPADWSLFQAALHRALQTAGHGEKLRILTGTTTSPTLARQIAAVLTAYPAARWCQWDGVSRANTQIAAHAGYGSAVEIVPRLDTARVIVGFDSDLFSFAPGHLIHARAWAKGRNPARPGDGGALGMNRVYALEATPGSLGAVADHRFALSPAEQRRILGIMAAAILNQEATPSDAPSWLPLLIEDLRAAAGHAFIHLGPEHPPEAQAIAIAMNEAMGARGKTMRVVQRVTFGPDDPPTSFRELISDMHQDQVDTLIVIDTNPLLTAPPELGFAKALRHVRFSVAVGQEYDETAAATRWFVPATHGFEGWSDARAFDGTVSIIQPQILPLYGARSPHEVLALLTGGTPASARDLVRESWSSLDDAGWTQALAEGVVRGSAAPDSAAKLKIASATTGLWHGPAGLTLLLRPDPHLFDGRHANNPWLQELPRPLTKLVWDNPLLVAPKLAERHGLKNGDMVRLRVRKGTMTAPVYILPGQEAGCVTALLGYGRTVTGGVGLNAGFDYYPLREMDGLTELAILGFDRIDGHYQLATTEHHDLLEGDPADAIRHTTLPAYQADPAILQKPVAEASLYPPAAPPGSGVKWGMSIDLNACIGCNACVTACQAENNTPTVGKEEVLRQHEMHWLRIDRYFEGGIDQPETFFQPVLCMHCETAPCEVVCPVGATMHDEEGLNVMVYNRCVGTRFCSNNCPYKVRRFNYFAYAREETRPPEARNNEVTTRARGVMEKCTFCVQRIAAARIESDKSDGAVSEDRVVTACQAACPTQAFSFGDLAHGDNEVSRRKSSPLHYALLEDRGTRPRVTYEGIVRNPNPRIIAKAGKGGA